jgi:P-type Ca2+ transporter type 2C
MTIDALGHDDVGGALDRGTGSVAHPYHQSVDEIADRLTVDRRTGLSLAEVVRRHAEVGPNRLAEERGRPAWRRFADQFRSVLVLILFGAAALAAAIGDLKDPIVIAGVLVLNGFLGFIQEGKAERALSALRKMLTVRVKVRRDGRIQEVDAEELVPGDIVLLEAGDRVPADGRLCSIASAAFDESMLTGESLPSDKTVAALAGDLPLGDRKNLAFMNTVMVRGRAEMIVTSTGMHTEVGRIAGLLAAEERRATPLEMQLHAVGTRLATVAGIAVSAVFVLGLLRGDSLQDAVLNSVALAVAAIPEGLPAVVTVTLAVGVHQMAKRNAIVKRLASVETLGSTTVICSDKTGTLTLNQMTARSVWHGGQRYAITGVGYDPSRGSVGDGVALPPTLLTGLVNATVCCDASLDNGALVGDPTEGAIIVAAAKAGLDPDGVRATFGRVGELPFDSTSKFMATVHRDDTGVLVLVVKGAPDVLIDRCTGIRSPRGVETMNPEVRATIDETLDAYGADGLRVLAVASRAIDAGAMGWPDEPDAETVARAVNDLDLDVLVAMVDPPRPEAADAIRVSQSAGIAVKMITGDHKSTASAIAAQLGITGRAVTGHDLDRMDDETLAESIDDIGVCSRVSPEHKVRIVHALRSRGHVIAMTGDGVNDAAALRAADIGVAMGITGTEVTKEAGDVILTDDNFATIVSAVERGRTIYDNIVTFVRFQLSTNLGAILTIVGAGLVGLPAPFSPLQVLFVNLIADGPPAMSLGLDPPKPGVMQRRPRKLGAPILTAQRIGRLVYLGAVMAVGTLGVLAVADDRVGRQEATTMTFTTFVLYQLFNAFNARNEHGSAVGRHSLVNGKLWTAIALVVAAQVLVVHVGAIQEVFDTVALSVVQWLACFAVAASVLVLEEARKLIQRIANHREMP